MRFSSIFFYFVDCFLLCPAISAICYKINCSLLFTIAVVRFDDVVKDVREWSFDVPQSIFINIWGTGHEVGVDNLRKGTCFCKKERYIRLMFPLCILIFLKPLTGCGVMVSFQKSSFSHPNMGIVRVHYLEMTIHSVFFKFSVNPNFSLSKTTISKSF